MRNPRNYFADLAAKASHGDMTARTRLRQQMESQMVYIVRRTVQTGVCATALDRRILAEARRLGAVAPQDLEDRISTIAQTLCASVLSNLHDANGPEPSAKETVVEDSRVLA